MIDVATLRNEPERFERAARLKGIQVDLDEVLRLDRERLDLLQRVEEGRRRRKELSRRLANISPSDRAAQAEENRKELAALSSMESRLGDVTTEWQELLLRLPGELAPDVPEGFTDADNVEIRRWGDPRPFEEEMLNHVEILERLGGLDRKQARLVAGSRAYALRGIGAHLEQAVLRLAFDIVVKEGAEPVSPPLLVRRDAMVGTGFFPSGEEDTYQIPSDELYLTGTAEVPLVALHRGLTLGDNRLPQRLVGVSVCFRREAGAAGRDTRGLYRVHQFNKVEQVSLVAPDLGVQAEEHERLLGISETILQRLELPYRVALASAGETGFGQYRKHEVETWMPSRGEYAETHSCSSLLDFQARRCDIRYRGSLNARFPFTLNNTAIASPRILIPLLEVHQHGECVRLPEALVPYLHGQRELMLGASDS